MVWLTSLLKQLVLAGVVVGGVVVFGQDPRVIALSFIVVLFLRLMTSEALIRIHEGRHWPSLKSAASRCWRAPAPGRGPLVWRHEQSGEPVGLRIYLLMGATYAAFAIPLLYVNTRREMDVTLRQFLDELQVALLLAVVYWIEDLASRSFTIDTEASHQENLAHNVGGKVLVLHIAILVSGGLVAYYQSSGQETNAWLFFGPLLVLKHLADWLGDAQARTKAPV
jgi:hypothetical protein